MNFVTTLNPFSFMLFKDPNRQNQPFDQAPRGGLDGLRGRSLPPNLIAPPLVYIPPGVLHPTSLANIRARE